MKRVRKGFTLVELLIVIAIIGTLAAMVTLSSSGATAQAKATTVLTGFKSIRSAIAMYSVASGDLADAEHFSNTASKEYFDPESLKLLRKFKVDSSDAGWTVTYVFQSADQKALEKFKVYSKDMSMTGKRTGRSWAVTLTTN